MRYVFFGSPRFARFALKELLEAQLFPVALVANPDKPFGRKKIITPPETKKLIFDEGLEDKIAIYQPEKLSELQDTLEAIKADVFVVAAYAKIIPTNILGLARLGVIGVHPSLLPLYRGASPIQGSLLSGEKETGVSLYLMDAEVDHGPVIDTTKLSLENTNLTYLELEEKLGVLGGQSLLKTLPLFFTGEVTPLPQDHARATFTKKFKTEDGFVTAESLKKSISGENERLAVELERKIRALNPEPGVWSDLLGKRVKLLKAHLEDKKLVLDSIQKEGGKPFLPGPTLFY